MGTPRGSAVVLLALGVMLPPATPAAGAQPACRLGTLWYLSAQRQEGAAGTLDEVLVKRGHVDLHLDITPGLSARITPDLTVDAEGEAEAPVKFAYLQLSGTRLGPFVRPTVQAGRVPTPWIAFEEGIARYRMQDGTFMDRLGFFASADEGLAVNAMLGEGLPAGYLARVRPKAPGRWGSIALGLYSGSGFKAPDRDHGLVVQGRISLRPLPDTVPGLQLSALGIRGEGNSDAGPAWKVAAFMASFETTHLAATLQRSNNRGVQSGTWVDAGGRALEGAGWSGFVELRQRPGPGWAAFVRHDWYDRDTRRAGARFTRGILGVAHHLTGGSAVLLDWERQSYEEPLLRPSRRLQLTVQLALGPWPLLPRSATDRDRRAPP